MLNVVENTRNVHQKEEMGIVISQLSWKIGGQQGEGVESTDRIFSTALNRLGLLFVWVPSFFFADQRRAYE